jgi:hypothetical protein
MTWPETITAWFGLISAFVVIAVTVGGVMIGLARNHIASAVTRSVHKEVPAVVERALREVNVKLDGIRINQSSLSAELGRVRSLEAKIDNGLTSKVNAIDSRQQRLIVQVGEIHGWLKAVHKWDGFERRDGS